MAAEYGATMGFFPWDAETIRYLAQSGRAAGACCAGRSLRPHELFVERARADPRFEELVEFDLGSVEPSLAGPTRPEHRVSLGGWLYNFRAAYADTAGDVGEPDIRADDATAAAWRYCDCGNFILYQHQQSVSDHHRRAARPERCGAGAACQTVGEDVVFAGLSGGDRDAGNVPDCGKRSRQSASTLSDMGA